MASKTLRVKASALIPVQQYGSVTLEAEVILVFDEESGNKERRTTDVLAEMHENLCWQVQQLNQENPAVKAWLAANLE